MRKRIYWLSLFMAMTTLATSIPVVSAEDGKATVSTTYNGWKKSGNRWLYYQNGKKTTGWVNINGYTYLFDSNGYMYTGVLGDYYLRKDGKLHVGWKKFDGDWRYYDTKNAKMKRGITQIGKSKYIFNNSGYMQNGLVSYNGSKYYTDKNNGVLKTGWVKLNNKWMYFDKTSGKQLTGLKQIGGSTYYLQNDGYMFVGTKEIDGYEYKFGADGALYSKLKIMPNGWKQYSNGDWVYYENNKRYTGYKKVNGKYYYFNNDGIMQTGWQYVNGQRLYFMSDGALGNSWELVNGKWVYYKNGKQLTGWIDYNGNKYYIASDGYMVTGEYKIGDIYYYFDNNGAYKYQVKANKVTNNTSANIKVNPMKYNSDKYVKTNYRKYFVDISEHNGRMDFTKLKRNADGVILRIGWGYFTLDKKFQEYLSNVKRYNIPFGVYHYSYALNISEAIQEADGVIRALKANNVNPDYPVYFDMEDADGWKKRHGITIEKDHVLLKRIIETFCNRIRAAGYEPGVYASKYWFTQLGDLSDYHIWLAHWGVAAPSMPYVGLWQFSDDGNGYKLGSSSNPNIDENYAYFVPRR